jgi:hypothetical protein
MRILLIPAVCLLFTACGQPRAPRQETITLSYVQNDIQKQFDTLYANQQAQTGVYSGFTEQALAACHNAAAPDQQVTQDVYSSMYLNLKSGNYDCVTTTTFQFPDGSIVASGIFNLVPGAAIAPDHDFPITGGSGAYRNIYGTYTRKYRDSTYHVELRYYRQHDEN